MAIQPNHLESPGKLSAKVQSSIGGRHFVEKELAHESHLIQHSEQPMSQFSGADLNVFKQNHGQRPRYNENVKTGSKSHWQ